MCGHTTTTLRNTLKTVHSTDQFFTEIIGTRAGSNAVTAETLTDTSTANFRHDKTTITTETSNFANFTGVFVRCQTTTSVGHIGGTAISFSNAKTISGTNATKQDIIQVTTRVAAEHTTYNAIFLIFHDCLTAWIEPEKGGERRTKKENGKKKRFLLLTEEKEKKWDEKEIGPIIQKIIILSNFSKVTLLPQKWMCLFALKGMFVPSQFSSLLGSKTRVFFFLFGWSKLAKQTQKNCFGGVFFFPEKRPFQRVSLFISSGVALSLFLFFLSFHLFILSPTFSSKKSTPKNSIK